MSLWRKRNDVSHDGQNRPKLFTMTATTDNEFSIKSDDLSIKQSKVIYTTPPQRTWVGLTDKEIEEIAVYPMNPTADLVRTIERKLKEKNT